MSKAWWRVSFSLLLLPLPVLADEGGTPAPPKPLERELEIIPGPEEDAPRPFRVPSLLLPSPWPGGVARCAQPVEDLSCYCLAADAMRPCAATGGVVRAK